MAACGCAQFLQNALGQKLLSIGTINTSLQWKSEPLLYTATAFQQWLNTKGAKKHLYVRHGLMHDDAVGTQRCRVKKLSVKLTCSGVTPGPDNHESAAAGANFVSCFLFYARVTVVIPPKKTVMT